MAAQAELGAGSRPDQERAPDGGLERGGERVRRELLADVVASGGHRRVVLVGLSKNAGKTTALNRLAAELSARGARLVLASTGRDGERRDAITELPKPAILAPAGAVLVTGREALGAGASLGAETSARAEPAEAGANDSAVPAEVEIIQATDLATPFGPVVIGRVARAGAVELTGAGSVARLDLVLKQAEAVADGLSGDRVTIIDGSLDRVAAAAPGLAEAVILASGASAGPDMDRTVRLTEHWLDLFALPLAPEAVRGWARRAFEARPLWLLPEALLSGPAEAAPDWPGDDLPGAVALAEETALGQADSLAALALGQARDLSGSAFERAAATGAGEPGSSVALAIAGAVTSDLVRALTEAAYRLGRTPPGLVARDPTHLFVERPVWRAYTSRGGRAWLLDRAAIVAVTVNPTAPLGLSYPAEAFGRAVKQISGARRVADVVRGVIYD